MLCWIAGTRTGSASRSALGIRDRHALRALVRRATFVGRDSLLPDCALYANRYAGDREGFRYDQRVDVSPAGQSALQRTVVTRGRAETAQRGGRVSDGHVAVSGTHGIVNADVIAMPDNRLGNSFHESDQMRYPSLRVQRTHPQEVHESLAFLGVVDDGGVGRKVILPGMREE